MNTRAHRMLGIAVAVAVAPRVAPDVIEGLVCAVVTVSTSGGTLSPDVDQRAWWRMLARALPRPMGHRGITHWWGLPTALALALASASTRDVAWWAVAGAVLGWSAHLAGDLAVGAGSPYRGPGVPMAPWWAHHGLGSPCGGKVERALVIVAPALACATWATGW